MLGRIYSRYRQVGPDLGRVASLLVTFGVFEGFLHWAEWRGMPVAARLPFRPGSVVLLMGAVGYGIGRVAELHPAWNRDYFNWLKATPWTSQKPLPNGPVELVGADVLVVGSLILLSALVPEPHALRLLFVFLLAHLAALAVTLALTRTVAFAYLMAFGLGLALLCRDRLWLAVVIASAVYLIAYEGLRRGFKTFPWEPVVQPKAVLHADLLTVGSSGETCGWPFDRLMREVARARRVSRLDATICCMLGSWWVFVLASFIRDPQQRAAGLMAVLCIVLGLCPIFRFAIYAQGYRSPLSFWGRIWTLRPIIPGYDQVLLAPLATFLVGPATVALFAWRNLPLDIGCALALGVTVLTALVFPPSLRRWRLTGRHRIVPAAQSVQGPSAVVQVN